MNTSENAGVAARMNEAAAKGAKSPGQQRVQAGLSAHLWLCASMLYMQMILYQNAQMIDVTGPASWWATALGAVGGLAIWLPTAWLQRLYPGEGLCGALRRALGVWLGGAACAVLGFVLVLELANCFCAMVGLCMEYLLQEASSRFIGMSTVAVFYGMLLTGGAVSASRLGFSLRYRLLFFLVLLIISTIPGAKGSNLYPLAGYGAGHSVVQGLLSGNAFCSVFVLGFIAPLTQGKPQASFKEGAKLLAGVTVFCMLMQFAILLTKPYAIVRYESSWALRLINAADYINKWGLMRTLEVLAQIAVLTVAAQGSLMYSEHALSQVHPGMRKEWVQGLLCALLLWGAWQSVPDAARLLTQWMPWRLPVVLAPLWLACGVGALRKRRAGKRKPGEKA